MSQELRFDGRVALVTGAGNGLGRAYALALAERGAAVVVNDLGGDVSGHGISPTAADKVVAEIKLLGGTAVPNYDSVEEGEKLVQTALDQFGKLDIVVNNAGILRDRSFSKISDDDWDIVNRVHLKGSFLVTQAAFRHMKSQRYGRIIMTTSTSGLYGNFGQANYSAAKAGLLGLSNTLAIEGKKSNILCNAVAPLAGSRLSASVMPPVRFERSRGAVVRTWNNYGTPEAANMGAVLEVINNFKGEMEHSTDIGAGTKSLKATIEEFSPLPVPFAYTDRDVILYALGVGVSATQPGFLQFVYENSSNFCALPTFGVIPAFKAVMASIVDGISGFPIDPLKVLHGEHYLEVYKSLPTSATLYSTVRVADILDKGSGALVLFNVDTVDELNEPVIFNQFAMFVVGSGKFCGQRYSPAAIITADLPQRPPDATVTEQTSVDQGVLYRLSGDWNPLHIDPGFSALAGYSQPILHGLCTFGISVRHVLSTFAGSDVSLFKAVKVRFSKPVLPGQQLKTEMWKDGSRVYFRTLVSETGEICISGAYVDLNIDSSFDSNQKASTEQRGESSSPLQCVAVFAKLNEELQKQPDLVRKVSAIIQWNITMEDNVVSTWILDLKTGPTGTMVEGKSDTISVDGTLTLSDDDVVSITSGAISPHQAFLKGKLKFNGNIMLAQKIGTLFNTALKSRL